MAHIIQKLQDQIMNQQVILAKSNKWIGRLHKRAISTEKPKKHEPGELNGKGYASS